MDRTGERERERKREREGEGGSKVTNLSYFSLYTHDRMRERGVH